MFMVIYLFIIIIIIIIIIITIIIVNYFFICYRCKSLFTIKYKHYIIIKK